MSHNNQLKEQALTYMNEKVIKVDERDRQMWELSIAVPRVHKALAVVFAILNILLPGFGTMLAACFS